MLGRDPRQPWEEDVCGHLGMPELRRCASEFPGMTLTRLSPLWDESLDLHKVGWAPSELLGHHPPEDVGQVLGRCGVCWDTDRASNI